MNLGFQLFQYHYDVDIMTGPNSRHNVFGLFYFGFLGSIIFSFLVGYLSSFFRNVIFYRVNGSVTGLISYVSLAMIAPFFAQDLPGLALDKLLSFFIFFLFYTLFHLFSIVHL